jgi:nucleoid-associated protein
MSLDIDQIALHQLVKRDEQTLDVVLRDSLLPTNAAVEEMMTELHRVYSAKSKALGLFNEGSELAEALRTCRKDDKDFLAFSRAATACATNWRSIRLPKAAWCCSANTVIWRWSTC